MPSLRLASARGIGLAVHVLGAWLPVAVVYGSVESGLSEFSLCRIQAGASGPPWWDYGQWAVVAYAVHVERRGALHAAGLIAGEPLCCLRRCCTLA
jgi:hypothetical protein